MQEKHTINVKGKLVDEHTRCEHYHSVEDVIAIRMKCCNEYYACIYCHTETAGHVAVVWALNEFDTKAVLCGICNTEMTISEYLKNNHKCPFCNARYNPGCSKHYKYYFDGA